MMIHMEYYLVVSTIMMREYTGSSPAATHLLSSSL